MTATVQNTLDDGRATTVAHPLLNYAPSLSNGIGPNQANRGWQSTNRPLANGANETLDLYDFAGVDLGAGAGLDGVGQAVVHEEIVAIAIVNENAIGAAGQLEIRPGPGNGWSPIGIHTVANGGALRGQGFLMKVQPADDGFDVTDAANHLIRFTSNGGALTYSIYLLARHDDDESSSSTSSSLSSSSWSSTSSSSSSTSSISASSSSGSQTSSSSQSSSSSSTSSSSSESSSSSISTSTSSLSPSSWSSQSVSSSESSSVSSSSWSS